MPSPLRPPVLPRFSVLPSSFACIFGESIPRLSRAPSQAISLIYAPAHADDRNRCSINQAWNDIPPLFRSSSSPSAFCTICFGKKPTPNRYLRIGKLEIRALPPCGIHRLTGAFHLYVRGASHSRLSHYQQTARQLAAVTFAPSSDNSYRNFSNIVSLQARLKVHFISR